MAFLTTNESHVTIAIALCFYLRISIMANDRMPLCHLRTCLRSSEKQQRVLQDIIGKADTLEGQVR